MRVCRNPRRETLNIIHTTNHQVLIQKCISKVWDLSQFLSEAAQMEDTSMQVRDIEARSDRYVCSEDQQCYEISSQESVSGIWGEICNYCGRSHYHPSGRECPAYGKQYRNCLKWNHFETVCRSKPMNTRYSAEESSNQQDKQQQSEDKESQEDSRSGIRRRVLRPCSVEESEPSEENSNDFQKTVDIKINGVDVRAEPGSGADVNLMDEHQFKALFNRSERKPISKSSEIRLSTLQHELPVTGEFTSAISNKTRETVVSVIEIRGRINSPQQRHS